MKRILLGVTISLGFILSSYQQTPRQFVDGPIKTIVIDPGHGGKDPGALGERSTEKDIVLKVALYLKEILAEELPSLRVVMTRDHDNFVELHQRAAFAQEHQGDFFVSIHCNGLENRSPYGTETYIMGINSWQESYERIVAENESILFEENHEEMYGGFDPSSAEGFIYFKLLKNVFRHESSRMASKVQEQYAYKLKRVDRGVKQAPFVVLYQSGMPAILTEMGFISNPREEAFLSSERGQKYLAAAIYRAIKNYNIEFVRTTH